MKILMTILAILAPTIWLNVRAVEPACQPAATTEIAQSRIEPLAAAARLEGGGKLTWTPAADDLDGADSMPFDRWIERYTEQANPTQAGAWRKLAAELRCQFQTLAVHRWEEPCENCQQSRILIWGCTAWGCAGLTGSSSWD